MRMIIGRSLTPLNSSRTMQGVRQRGDNSRGNERNVRRDSSPASLDAYAVSRLRGRPLLAPLARAAAALAFERRRPPRCPVARDEAGCLRCPRDCPCGAPELRLQSQRQPTRLVDEVIEKTGSAAEKHEWPRAGSAFSKPPPSASRPPHRGTLSIRRTRSWRSRDFLRRTSLPKAAGRGPPPSR
jgi:hypothetical protein